MRFFSNGPNIPDRLLEKSDEGRVVFFCGAGVSRHAGMPNFVDLTKYIVESLGVPEDSDIRRNLSPCEGGNDDGPRMPLDQIFETLYQEYDRDGDVIDKLVAKKLKTKRGIADDDLNHHRIILRESGVEAIEHQEDHEFF